MAWAKRALATGMAVGLLWKLRESSFRWAGKVVFITGGSRGLGLVLGRMLAARGARLALCARDANELTRAQDELQRLGAEVLALECDVSQAAQVSAAIGQAVRRFGRLDVLINCAGIIQVGPLQSLDLQDFRDAIETNYFGVVHACLAALPSLRRSRGRIVNISSIGGAVAVPHLLPYTGSKFAVTGFSQGLRAEVAREGVTVTTILPAVLRTGSHVQALFKGQREAEFAWFAAGASTPGLSVQAERAARRILAACARGDGYVVVGVQAKALRLLHALAPSVTARLMTLVNALMPAPGAKGGAEPGYMQGDGPLPGAAVARKNHEIPWASH